MVALTYVAVAAAAVSGAFAAPAACAASDPPNFEFGPHNLARRQDYNQNYKTGGNVNFSPSNNGYSVSFSGAGDFVVGKGWRQGSARNITFTGNTSRSSGTVLVSVYGWTRNPLVEYYVQEWTSDGKGSAQGQKLGTFTSDGGTYEIWKHQQVNQPSIAGTSTFWQYISNRVDKKADGSTITMANHFAAWAKAGLNLGSHDYQVLATEGWGNAGGNSKYTLQG
ncbi:glycoside hydrolase [Staphylotrichum tortipilum]|uniref:Endo-1,4-beta-xylanase n=1 Tax=Staphylotrichum tortipilum TaxID=2831512 RepID=A0AAN6MFK0_9PEZI|nr:glycoside hydrolase [Staphylotrichum longicolle]